MSVFGRARCRFFGNPEGITLPGASPEVSTLPLVDVCKQMTPPCQLNPFLFNGHLQTFWTAFGRAYDIPVFYRRHIFNADENNFPGTFAVDFCIPEDDCNDDSLPPRTTHMTQTQYDAMGSEDSKPMFVTLHGLSGGSYELYVRNVLKPLLDAGWEGCVVNSRGCARSKITSSILYNARATWDTRQTVRWLKDRYPNRPLFGIGFSLGANILVNVSGKCVASDGMTL